MWKYKFSCPYGGRESSVFLLIGTITFTEMILLSVIEGMTKSAFLAMYLPFLIIGLFFINMLTAFLICHRLTKEDKIRISCAKPLEWHSVREGKETAEIPVSDFYYVPFMWIRGHGSSQLTQRAVLICYLPEGKYFFLLPTRKQPPAQITVIRYKFILFWHYRIKIR